MTRTAQLIATLFVFSFLAIGGVDGTVRSSKVQEDSLRIIFRDAKKSAIPLLPLYNKAQEGIAKKRPRSEIIAAVLQRKKLLLQIREQNSGVMPETYMKSLLSAEKSNVPSKAAPLKYVEKRDKALDVVPLDTPKSREYHLDQKPNKAAPVPTKAADDEQDRVLKRSEKGDEKIIKRQEQMEKKLEKAAEKAEKRIEKMEDKALHKNR